jgi:hypothetical protein
MARFPVSLRRLWPVALLVCSPLLAGCPFVDDNDTPQAVGQCVQRAGATASYPPPSRYAARATGVLVARFHTGRAVLLFAGRDERPSPPAGQPVTSAVGGRVAYWWEVPPAGSERGALTTCLTTAHSFP